MAMCFLILNWTHSSTAISLLYWEVPSYTQYSRCSLSSAKERGKITFSDMLACTFANTAPYALTFFTPASSYSNAPPVTSFLFCKSAFYPVICQPALLHGVILSRHGTWHFLSSLRFLWAHISSLSRSLWWIAALCYLFGNLQILQFIDWFVSKDSNHCWMSKESQRDDRGS